jgi:hypothetical protein
MCQRAELSLEVFSNLAWLPLRSLGRWYCARARSAQQCPHCPTHSLLMLLAELGQDSRLHEMRVGETKRVLAEQDEQRRGQG